MPAMARAGALQSQESGTPVRSPMCVAGARIHKPSPAVSWGGQPLKAGIHYCVILPIMTKNEYLYEAYNDV